jgi:signal transduction histidine kinase
LELKTHSSSPERDLAVVERLIELLASSPNVERTLPAVLPVLLETIGREGGALLVSAPLGAGSPLIVQHSVPGKWSDQLFNPQGSLREIAQRVLRVGEQFGPVPALDLAAVVPVAGPGRAVGVLLVYGPPCSADEQQRLAYFGHYVGLALHLSQAHTTTPDRGQELEALHKEVTRSRSTLMALFDGIPNPIYIIDRDYKLVAVNKASAQKARPEGPPRLDGGSGGHASASDRGRMPRELVGRLCYQALYGRTEPCVGCRVMETMSTGQINHRTERRVEDADQTSEWEISTYPIRSEGQLPGQVIVFEQDVTEKRRLEASLAQSEKLAAIGQLAAGVAHEINNPLAAIIANSQLLHRELPQNPDWQESVDLIARAGERAQRVVRGLLDFARQERYDFDFTDVNASIESAAGLIQHQLVSHAVTLRSDLEPDLPRIQASYDHLQSVWLNLLMNAVDALNHAPGEVRVSTRQHDDYVHVSIVDTGMGIPAERLARIFEPFYTTKSPGRGTGLGLAMSQQIIKHHCGQIRVLSRVGQGTSFTVILPIVQPAVPPQQPLVIFE